MVILSRAEKEKLVLEMYSQGKTYKQIASEIRISPRDIGTILNKAAAAQEKEKDQGEYNKQNENNNNNNNNSLSTRAYELFSEGKSPIDVAIALNLRQSETERLYKEYWKLKRLYSLNRVYQEVKDDIVHFLNLYKLSKAEGMGPEEVVNLLQIANNKNGRGLKRIENRYQSLKEEINSLELVRLDLNRKLGNLQDQIKALTRVVNSLQLDSKEEQRKLIWLLEEKKAVENLVEHSKNNEEYQRLEQIVEKKANDLLSDKRLILKLALFCLIESMKNNKDKYNYLINGGILTSMPGTAYSSNNNNQLFLVKQRQQQHFSDSQQNDEVGEIYKSLLLEEAEKLYQQLVSRLTNSTITEAAFSN
jgi:hypothetical protein